MTTDPAATDCADDDVRRLARKDRQAAFHLMVHRYRQRLIRHADGIVRDADIAADVVQDVFIKAMREPRLFDDDFRIAGWLYRVTGNLSLNTIRDSRRRGEILSGLGELSERPPNQQEAVLAQQRATRIGQALRELTANHRQVITERFYNDLSCAEIAEVLDVRLGTVMSRLSRAKDALIVVVDQALAADL